MHEVDLILTLAGAFAVALAFGFATHRLGLSPIVGYLLAGVAVGPHTPGFVANQAFAQQLAEVGVVLLMFGVGLHFHFRDLLAVRAVAAPGAVVQSAVATVLAAAACRAFGWDWRAGIVFGLAISVASTVVLVRVLSDRNELHTPAGHVAVGWLVVEDLLTVVVLVLLPVLFGRPEQEREGVAAAIGGTALKLVGLVLVVVVLGGRVIPYVLERVAATRSRELFTLSVLTVALGIAVGSATLFGVSMALGAFLAGMVVARSEFSLRAAAEALPMRESFAVLFFVSVGMLLDPRRVADAPGLAIATLGVVLVGKPAAAIAMVLFLRRPLREALAVGVALAQIGEFSFILAALGERLGILSGTAMNTVVAVAIVSITLNPLLYRTVGPIAAWLGRRRRLAAWIERRAPAGLATAAPVAGGPVAHRAVVVGYGPVGRTVVRLLRENRIEPTVIELNLETVRRIRADGGEAVYGDAIDPGTLARAGIAQAGSLILSTDRLRGGEEAIRAARELNPSLRVFARAAYLRDLPALRRAGAHVVFAGEGEVALAFTERILRGLGATPEQIDRERERVHAELFSGAEGPESVPGPAEAADEPRRPAEPAGGTGAPPPPAS